MIVNAQKRSTNARCVVGAYPLDGARGRRAGHHGEAREGRAGAAVTTEAAELDTFAPPGARQEVFELRPQRVPVARQTEVRPVDVRMRR